MVCEFCWPSILAKLFVCRDRCEEVGVLCTPDGCVVLPAPGASVSGCSAAQVEVALLAAQVEVALAAENFVSDGGCEAALGGCDAYRGLAGAISYAVGGAISCGPLDVAGATAVEYEFEAISGSVAMGSLWCSCYGNSLDRGGGHVSTFPFCFCLCPARRKNNARVFGKRGLYAAWGERVLWAA
jgi:hypothetical protein